jgi:lipopolysaccharide core heptose(I) kinase
MKNLVFEKTDQGRITFNTEYKEIMHGNGLIRFEDFMNYQGGEVAKNLLKQRTTQRIEFKTADNQKLAFYLKRHTASPIKEYIKPLFRLTRPILGAKNEWNAMIQFYDLGIPSMIPVAMGESGSSSFVISLAIEGCEKLSHWMENDLANDLQANHKSKKEFIKTIGNMTRKMHGSGYHHQDYYLTHFLKPVDDEKAEQPLYLIDLGRVQSYQKLPKRWIIKDLAQLRYSSFLATKTDRYRFIKEYFGHRPSASDWSLLQKVERKAKAINRHTKKNRL